MKRGWQSRGTAQAEMVDRAGARALYRGACLRAYCRWQGVLLRVRTNGCRRTLSSIREEEGQGTTEYAILVGILVVIAIAAIAIFRGRVQELWDSIATSINGL